MAIDTKEKRFSMLGFGNPTIKHVMPQGALGVAGRTTLLDLYSGISLTVVNMQPEWDYETRSNSTLVLKTEVDSMELESTITSIIMKTGY